MTTVLVSDGGTNWVADRAALVEALEKLGWTCVGRDRYESRWEEPVGLWPYSLLCAEVDCIRIGYDEITDEDHEGPTFVWCPHAGHWALEAL